MKGGAVLFLGVEGPRLSERERAVLARVRPAGVVLVQRNVAGLEDLLALLAELHAAAPEALVAIDAEGGRVDRLRAVFGPAPAGADLARRPPSLARRSGRWIGASLRAIGIEIDLAPVLDLDRGHSGNALDGRCLGATPRAVITRGRAFLEGLERSGTLGCIKHFPGLGGARADTHAEGAPIGLPAAALRADLAPFAALAPAADAVMVGHAVYPALDPDGRPASVSPPIAAALLRRRLRFRGTLFSDDLEMGALAGVGSLAERGEAALAAGCDALLFCRRIEEAPAIAERLGRARHAARLAEAAARIERLRRRLADVRRRAARLPAPAEIQKRLAALAR